MLEKNEPINVDEKIISKRTLKNYKFFFFFKR